MIKQKTLLNFLNKYLESDDYDDYAINGLQVEGNAHISKIAFAVSASLDAILKAKNANADTLIVHHGLFWKGDLRPITGNIHKRIKTLIENDINLIAYHLPLDGNLTIGHAKVIAQKLDLKNISPFGNHRGKTIGVKGNFSKGVSKKDVLVKLQSLLKRKVISTESIEDKKIKSLGIVSGGAGSYWREALNLNLDAFLTGEIREQDWHEAHESNIHLFAGGHNATEEFGILQLQKLLEDTFKVKTVFFPSKNPI